MYIYVNRMWIIMSESFNSVPLLVTRAVYRLSLPMWYCHLRCATQCREPWAVILLVNVYCGQSASINWGKIMNMSSITDERSSKQKKWPVSKYQCINEWFHWFGFFRYIPSWVIYIRLYKKKWHKPYHMPLSFSGELPEYSRANIYTHITKV